MAEDKSIKILLDYSDENGSRSKKEMSIKINTPTLKDKSQPSYRKSVLTYTLSFSLKIPEHIHSALIGKTVPVWGLSRRNEIYTYQTDFPKTITRESIELLTTSWWEVITDYEWIKEDNSRDFTKVIFYGFQTMANQWKSDYNGDLFGNMSSLKYNIGVGYICEISGKKLRFNEHKKLINESNNREYYRMKMVEFTEERWLFFENIQKSFDSIIDKVKTFEECISEETINQMITDKSLKLI